MALNNKKHLDASFKVHERFIRSANIKLDWQKDGFLNGYLLTPTGEAIATRIAEGFSDGSAQRAWSITGPYGSGKSSFALFLADLLCNAKSPHEGSERIRRKTRLEKKKLFPILLVGKRESLDKGLLNGIAESVAPLSGGLSRELKKLAGKANPENELADIFRKITQASKKAGYSGVLLVLDELGKYLEHAALHPDSDLFVLQELAEIAARSNRDAFIFVTILHSAFSEYLGKSDGVQRAEWQKIQGRFIDVAFQEPVEQFLKLMGTAIVRRGTDVALARTEKKIGKQLASESMKALFKRVPLDELLPRCLPIEPVTALLSWSLFRSKLAQNERSLFAFLSSDEPFGFQRFLRESAEGEELPLYSLDLLHDYVKHALGDALFSGDKSKRWAEIENSLGRLPGNAPSASTRVVKTIGLLSLYGAAIGLKASREILEIALGDAKQLKATLDFLRDRSIIIYRKHESAFALWEGSDIDLESSQAEALRHIGAGSISARLIQTVALRPIVAKAHYIKTGTLRYFGVRVTEASTKNIERILAESISPADGSITFVLSASRKERIASIEAAKKLSGKKPQHLRLLAFPKENLGLDRVLKDVEAWEWIGHNLKALEGDAVARKEVTARIVAAKNRLEEMVAKIFGIQGQFLDPDCSDWVYEGKVQRFQNPKEFLQRLSKLCDETYPQSPEFLNELLNREELSSASTKARRNLIEMMIANSGTEGLGIEGFPPEKSMYASMLQQGKFHKKTSGHWSFGKPSETWLPVWKYIEQFFKSTQHGRKPVTALFKELGQPPYGMKQGPIPVLFCCAILEKKDSIALYDQGMFIPEIRIEALERLIRVPENFEIQEYASGQVERDVLEALEEKLSALKILTKDGSKRSLLSIVKPLMIFSSKLPVYTKQTKRIVAPNALEVRDLLLKAKDPNSLVFTDLPKAVGASLRAKGGIETFAQNLTAALKALQRVYPQLLDELEIQLRAEFGLSETEASEIVRKKLQVRALPMVGRTSDPWVGTVIREASQLGDRDWREVLGRAVNKGNPIHQWQDVDVMSFQLNLARVAKDFVRLEELVSEQTKTGHSEILRVGILNGKASEARAIVSVSKEQAPQVLELSESISELIGLRGKRLTSHIKVAALAKVLAQFLNDREEKNGNKKEASL